MNMATWATEHTIQKIVAGSRLYGTHRADSDWDYRGVCHVPPAVLLGLQSFDQYQSVDDNGNDIIIYGATKFVRLALDCNPNILDTLFARPNHWLCDTDETFGDWHRFFYDKRHLYLSQRVRHTFSGYAFAQLKRLQGHRKWLLNPPNMAPDIADYGGWLHEGANGEQRYKFPDQDKQKQYQDAKQLWDNYQVWLKERNPKRADNERKIGYDTKNAGHLARLLLKGCTILETGDYDPTLTDGDLEIILDIMHGNWSYEKLLTFANEQEHKIKNLHSDLPHKPDWDVINAELCKFNAYSLSKHYSLFDSLHT